MDAAPCCHALATVRVSLKGSATRAGSGAQQKQRSGKASAPRRPARGGSTHLQPRRRDPAGLPAAERVGLGVDTAAAGAAPFL